MEDKRQRKIFLIAVIVVIALTAYFLLKPDFISLEEVNDDRFDQDLSNPISLVFIGDIMLERGVEYMVEKKGEGDFKFPFLKITEYLRNADLLFGNLESQISDKGEKVGSIYSFRAKPEALEGLTYAGFDVLSIANNHAFDYGWLALEDSLKRLQEANIAAIGIDSFIKEIRGTKIGFLSYTNLGQPAWGINLASWENLDNIEREIKNLENETDLLIISLHAGEEYMVEPNQFQVEFSRRAIEAGADIVINHHSHVIQPYEKYKDGHIFFGLGNFVFDQGFSEETMKGLLVSVLVEDKKIKEIKEEIIKMNGYFQPEI